MCTAPYAMRTRLMRQFSKFWSRRDCLDNTFDASHNRNFLPGRAVPHHPRRHSGRHAVAKFPGSIKKKLCPGQPTGDLLKAIVDQREGYQGQRDPAILLRLRNLHQVASLTSSTTTAAGHIPGTQGDDTPFLGRVCRQCSRSSHDDVEFQKTLLVCSRCKSMYYCSRECQTETGRPTRRRAKKRAIPA